MVVGSRGLSATTGMGPSDRWILIHPPLKTDTRCLPPPPSFHPPLVIPLPRRYPSSCSRHALLSPISLIPSSLPSMTYSNPPSLFTKQDIITTDFCYGFLQFSPSLTLKLPGGVGFDLMRYWDGQPVRFCQTSIPYLG